MNILLIDDDIELTDLMRRFLGHEGFSVDTAAEGASGLERMRSEVFDLAVIDVMMPGKNGMDVLRELRAFSRLPVIMLTARGEEMDRIIGLELGADDYIAKPCNPRELAARIRAVLRRSEAGSPEGAKAEDSHQVQHIASFEWHPQSRRIMENGSELVLTSSEYNILSVLLSHAGEVVEKNALTEQALGKRHGPFDRTLDVHIGRIRKKLAPLDNGEARIKTVRSVGWLLALD
ncbi:MAG: DNA-binding response regulator [Zetaproteobacteria bacterium CG12_big_fil_rev_8_21_14_0_65_55_1124]|nr:MAG: DNA-binding response regulator [Zetaproteobacteria bacterium CG1_02_55_237]PIS19521.1 MAG: DNA-binding response regulator [Zetaproteobacteria bacterium CG08_land_8_20_14_0_20_55_17]PIW42378.1 MAG: DNA-binding response regulator [Zetaproteobacteria bacterium CG12_big_fil_rev_8_21_14_0_65_55_1124]PIY52821.1 MAG: DNA-binding response regulator [Zetaproteobacteria bacterium CG_4_10_14_0_8_um_filter_55_43]PIZ38027.1 MAG: DNA-binding response regulator [Zetaproteobacteria bacterium CG_4_10_14